MINHSDNKQNSGWSFRKFGLALCMVGVAWTADVTVPAVSARGAPDSFADLAEKLTPAVVNISTLQTIRRNSRNPRLPRLPEGTPFGEFFDEFRERFEEEEPRQATSLGSGFIVGGDGYVVTNNHVIDGADEITITLEDGTEYMAEVVGGDARSDLALLKVEVDEALPHVTWGDSDKDRIGDWVMAVGNPYGLGNTVTAGIISGRNRAVGGAGPDVDYIQTDAPINRGNSGGPLFNMDGQVIGVNSAILSPSGGNIGIGFSIPASYASYAIEQLKQHGKIRRGWLGVFISPFDEDAAESLGIKDVKAGALVNQVQEGSPAESAGFEVGDVIYSWDGRTVENQRDLQQVVARTEIGKPVKVKVLRGGEAVTLDVVTGELPNGEDEDAEGRDDGRRAGEPELLEGMALSRLDQGLRQRFNIDEAVEGVVIVDVSRRSAAWRQRIRPGAVIMRVNQQSVSTPGEVVEILDAAREAGRESALFLINFRGDSVHIVLQLEEETEE